MRLVVERRAVTQKGVCDVFNHFRRVASSVGGRWGSRSHFHGVGHQASDDDRELVSGARAPNDVAWRCPDTGSRSVAFLLLRVALKVGFG